MPLPADDGGSTILAYELLMDDGLQSSLAPVYEGLERKQRIEEGVVKGRQYRLMHRVRNSQGWSEYSDMTYILAADRPSKPPHSPSLVDVDET
jgi:hypothetical protein